MPHNVALEQLQAPLARAIKVHALMLEHIDSDRSLIGLPQQVEKNERLTVVYADLADISADTPLSLRSVQGQDELDSAGPEPSLHLFHTAPQVALKAEIRWSAFFDAVGHDDNGCKEKWSRFSAQQNRIG
jgi:hypothetical protein